MPRRLLDLFCLLPLLVSCAAVAKPVENYPFPLVAEDGGAMDSVVCRTARDYLTFSDRAYNNKNVDDFLHSAKCFHLRSNWRSAVKNPKDVDKEAGDYLISTPTHGTIHAYGAPVIDD